MQGNRWARIKNHERSILGSVFNAKCKRRIKTETEERRAVSGVELETKAVVVWLIAKITKSKQKNQSKKTKGKYFQYYLLSVCFSCWRNELCSEKTHCASELHFYSLVWLRTKSQNSSKPERSNQAAAPFCWCTALTWLCSSPQAEIGSDVETRGPSRGPWCFPGAWPESLWNIQLTQVTSQTFLDTGCSEDTGAALEDESLRGKIHQH